MHVIEREVNHVAAHDYKLVLTVPTPAELARMRKLQRDRTSLVRRPRRTPSKRRSR
jgi:hypothetical protein